MTISSEMNLFIVGVVLVAFVVLAPEGILGLVRRLRGRDPMPALLEVEGLTKRFGGFLALNRLSLHVKPGERFGLIGPNGSGKTTLINCVSGSLLADGSRILFEGQEITTLPAHRRTRLGIIDSRSRSRSAA